MSESRSGGCQCGAVRFEISGPLDEPMICHCRTCQKAHGAPLVSWATVALGALAWTRGTPAHFRSSARARRLFCAQCGTPLAFLPDRNGTVDIALAALDRPQAIAPLRQGGIEGRMPWFEAAHFLPEETTTDDPHSFQHPDHDTQTWPKEQYR